MKRRANGVPAVRMPPLARAAGFWQGKEPEVIRALSYAERRILCLARVHVCVKRVSPHVAPWGVSNEAARPQYTTRNVVAFSQDPDTAVRLCCLEPAELAQTICVQFEGADKDVVRRESSLYVDLDRLRSAMWWFATHNWQ